MAHNAKPQRSFFLQVLIDFTEDLYEEKKVHKVGFVV